MTQDETNKILTMITEIYPSFRKDRDPVLTSRLWHELFKNVPYASVRLALMDFFATDTKGFAPTPGALFSLIRSRIETEEELTEMDAWALTRKAISRGTYYSREEFGKLPASVRAVVRTPENIHAWASMDEWQVQNNLAPWFLRAYKNRLEKDLQHRFLPQETPSALPEDVFFLQA